MCTLTTIRCLLFLVVLATETSQRHPGGLKSRSAASHSPTILVVSRITSSRPTKLRPTTNTLQTTSGRQLRRHQRIRRPNHHRDTRRKHPGFNLLWLVSSRMETNKNDQLARKVASGEDPKKHPLLDYSDGIAVNSSLQRQILRYERIQSQYLTRRGGRKIGIKQRSNQTRLNRFISRNSIGFETEFCVDNSSGSGYLMTGRAADSLLQHDDGYSEVNRLNKVFHDTSSRMKPGHESSSISVASWFGLYFRIQSSKILIRLEYRNNRLNGSNQKFIAAIDDKQLSVGSWHKLAVQINFRENSIYYWLNCSDQQPIKIKQTQSIPYSFFSVFRLLQQRTSSKKALKVSFKSLVITDGGERDLAPRQCNRRNRTTTNCPGGRVHMLCGPSCEPTCLTRWTNIFQLCAAACIEGCHCPMGTVLHRGRCIPRSLCPCSIERKRYSANVQISVNNEICTCIGGLWRCFAVARIRELPRNKSIPLGKNGTLTCRVSGRPLPTVRWTAPKSANYKIEHSAGGRTSILHIYNVAESDGGNYTCMASRTIDNWHSNATAYIMITDPPRIVSLPSTVTVTLGAPVISIDCYVTGLPPPRATWARTSGKRWPENAEYFAHSPGVFRLKITNVKQNDAGEYKCYAMNDINSTIASVVVIVKVPPPSPMAFSKPPIDICVRPGHTANFPCKVIGQNMETNVTWNKDGKELNIDGKKIRKLRFKLVVRRVQKKDAGLYSCTVQVHNTTIKGEGSLMIKGRMLPWSSWSQCSVSCGKGRTSKKRLCTGEPPNSKTCHGKFVISKACNPQVCPGVCSSFGDPHFTTFDGSSFNFQGDCGYTLAQDVPGNNFKIVQYNFGCASHVSCTNKITAVLGFSSLSGVVELRRDGLVLLNEVPVVLPHISNRGKLFIDHVGLYLTMKVEDEVEIRWAIPHRIYVTVSGKYSARTKGLCGNFNDNPDDDRKSPSGKTMSSDLEFAQSWVQLDDDDDFSCSAARIINEPCAVDSERSSQANDICRYLLDEARFGECHKEVSPYRYIETCKSDICRARVEDTNIYFCITLSAYAEECSRKGRILKWRTNEICPIICSGGRVYKECGPKCVQYCKGAVATGVVCNANARCLPGCYCPDGQVLHKGKCIGIKECPCPFAGIEYENKSVKSTNCKRCHCINGQWRCQFDRFLCEYPPAVINGPHTQIVPYGKSVTFCCQIVGIPKPKVEWYHNGIRISSVTKRSGNNRSDAKKFNQWFKLSHHSNATLYLSNISTDDAGSYVCNATNSLGSYLSRPAYLRIADSLKSICKEIPSENFVRLPENCFVTKIIGEKETQINLVNLGRCSGTPCHSSESVETEINQSTCGKPRFCCQPTITKLVHATCTYENYVSRFGITIVKGCRCSRCGDNLTIVEGVVRSATRDQPIKHGKLSYRGRTVGYTSNTGSFRINIPNLPPDASSIALKISDLLFKRYTTTVTNLAVIPGRSALHTIHMHEAQIRIPFQATRGFVYVFKLSAGYSHRIRLNIPPDALIRDRMKMPYRGTVTAIMTLLDKRNLSGNRSVIGMTLPGSPLAITLSGEEHLLSPSIILYVTFYTALGKILDLVPGNTATLSLSAGGLHSNLKLWTLEDLTGRWRESNDRLDVSPHRTKRGKKMLIVTARIKRFNAAIALGTDHSPCYLRVQVLDSQNEIIPEVRVAFKACTKSVFEMVSLRHTNSTDYQTSFKSYVDGLTSYNTPMNGLCLPTGCRDAGILSAYRPGQDLLLLKPDVPPKNMGEVIDHEVSPNNRYIGSSVSTRLPPTNSSQPSSVYFQTKQECYETRPGILTYVFRDRKVMTQDSSKLGRYSISHQNEVIRTFGSPRPTRIEVEFCHFKIKLRFLPSFFEHNSSVTSRPHVIEAVTFSNGSSGLLGGSQHLTMLGWRHVAIEDLDIEEPRLVERIICIDYRCADSRVFIDSKPFVYITIRYTDSWSVKREDRPNCRLVPNANHSSNEINNFTNNEFGGYIYFSEVASHIREDANIGQSYNGRSLLESKRVCSSSNDSDYSAYFVCL